MKKRVMSYKNLNYVMFMPDDFDESKKYPVILKLHGAGSRGDDISLLENSLYFSYIEKYSELEFVSVMPQCPADMTWFAVFEQLTDFTKYIFNSSFTDKKRFYCMGVSMGGYGAWELAMQLPELFAAIVPICGGGMYWNAGRLKNVSVWAFHGGKDGCVFPEESKKMVDAVNQNGGSAKLTIYPENEHDAWNDTFGNIEVFRWLLSCKKTDVGTAENKYTDSKIYG